MSSSKFIICFTASALLLLCFAFGVADEDLHAFVVEGVMVGDSMSRKLAWADTVQKLRSQLSKWKVKTLSIGGRLTFLKSVLGASP
nr:RNA-directed DNA polymerase, eukaryota [Tanacetum cinerariifolium]